MRQLNTEAYMHSLLRMNVSSYLYCNLLLDCRRGERYFAEIIIDWDLSNNARLEAKLNCIQSCFISREERFR